MKIGGGTAVGIMLDKVGGCEPVGEMFCVT